MFIPMHIYGYLSERGVYSLGSETDLYAGLMILPAFEISSKRCADQPGTRAIANSGVNSCSGKSSML